MLNALKVELGVVEMKIKNLQEYQRLLNSQKIEIESREFIKENGIKLSDVELSKGENKPWFDTTTEFAAWMLVKSSKKWAEWHDQIISRSDLIKGACCGVGRVEHLED